MKKIFTTTKCRTQPSLGLFVFLLGVLFSFNSIGQSTITVGTGTSTDERSPIYSYYGYSFSQTIYLQSEVMASGGSAGVIDKIRLELNSGNVSANADQWTVFIGHTNKTEFTSNSDWENYSNLTQVFSGTVTNPASGNWLEITFSTPFNYNGLDNLIIAVDENASGYANGGDRCYWRKTDMSNRSLFTYNDWSNPDPQNPPSGTRLGFFPNIQFDITPFTPCAATPILGNTIAAADTVCYGTATDLSLQNDYSTTAGIDYQWQIDTGMGWQNLVGDTLPVYATNDLYINSEFRCFAVCTATNAADTSAPTMVYSLLPDSVSVSPDSYAYCSGSSVNLTAVTSGNNGTFSWSPSNGLSATTGATVAANPTNPRTYTVIATDSNGCQTQASAFVTSIEDVTADIVATPSVACSPGSPVVIEVSNYPTTVSGGGNWEYQWKDQDGIVVSPWSPVGTNYTFTPTNAAVYEYQVELRSTACLTDTVQNEIKVPITIGFGADVTAIHVNCNNPLGLFDLSDIFGTGSIDTTLFIDFGAGTNPAVTYFGDAFLDGNLAAATPSATGKSGGIIIDPQGSAPTIGNAFNVQFDLTVDQPINNYGTGGADGISYSFADDVSSTSNGYQNGTGSKLRLCFDAADNSNQSGNVTGIYLVYGWGSTNAFGPNSNEVLAYENNTALWKGQQDVPVTIDVDNNGLVNVTVGGVAIFQDIQLPASYLTEDISTWKHAITAATGGDAERHAISNFLLSKESLHYAITSGNGTTPPTTWQTTTQFSGLLPGDYHIWIGNPSDLSCYTDLGLFEINNNFPAIDLGGDTIICENASITLDAGAGMASYLWSSNNDTLQTLTVNAEGVYSVSVTDTLGCSAVGTIEVSFADSVKADDLFTSVAGYDVSMIVINGENVGSIDWYLGDNTSITDGGSMINHTYNDTGMFEVMVVLHDVYGCNTDTLLKTVHVTTPLSVGNLKANEFKMYPNPASTQLNVILNNPNVESVQVFNVNGQLVYQQNATATQQLSVDVSSWNNGLYLLNLNYTDGSKKVERLIINH